MYTNHRDWTIQEWRTVIFPDERSVERGTGKDQTWVFRTPRDSWWDKTRLKECLRAKHYADVLGCLLGYGLAHRAGCNDPGLSVVLEDSELYYHFGLLIQIL